MVNYYPLVTFLVTIALTALIGRQFGRRRKRHQLVWTVSLGLLALAALLAFLSNPEVVGWSEVLYKAYLPLTAIPVGLIGLGVLLLFGNHPSWAKTYGVYWALTGAAIVAFVMVMPLADPDALGLGPDVGYRALPTFGFISILQSIPGAAVFIGGGVFSWWADRTRRYGLVLALGGVLFTLAGSTSRLGGSSLFFFLTAVAAVVTFLGFIWAVEFSAARAAAAAKA